MCDLKTLACSGNYKDFTASNLNDRGTFPVKKRVAKVRKDYLKSARDFDQKSHNIRSGEVGPIEANLLEYCARDGPNPHAAVGVVLCVFGKLSNRNSYDSGVSQHSAFEPASFWTAFTTLRFRLAIPRPLRTSLTQPRMNS